MSDSQTPETSEQLSARESIVHIATSVNELEDEILKHVDTAIKEASFEKYGHVAGNMPARDIASMLTAAGLKSRLANELARTAVARHERFRWSEKGKEIQNK